MPTTQGPPQGFPRGAARRARTPGNGAVGSPRPGPAVNVGEAERWLSLLGGAAVAALGLRQQSAGGLLLAGLGGALVYRGLSGHCPAYSALGVQSSDQGAATAVRAGHGVRIDRSVTIARPPAEVYRFWRDFENLPRFMTYLQKVEVTGPYRTRWTAGALGVPVSWEAEVFLEKEPSLIAWRSLAGSTVDTAGSVHFTPAPGGRGTEVRVQLKYDPPGGQLTDTLAWLTGQSPAGQITEDLRRLKQLLEAGENPTTHGQSSGVRSLIPPLL